MWTTAAFAVIKVAFTYATFNTGLKLDIPAKYDGHSVCIFNHSCFEVDNTGTLQLQCYGLFEYSKKVVLLAREGSSVTLRSQVHDAQFIEWEHINDSNPDAQPEYVLQYYKDSGSTIYSKYRGRIQYNETRNSITFLNVSWNDGGIYRSTVNLQRETEYAIRLHIVSFEADTPLTTDEATHQSPWQCLAYVSIALNVCFAVYVSVTIIRKMAYGV